jgi:hypothetical protein
LVEACCAFENNKPLPSGGGFRYLNRQQEEGEMKGTVRTDYDLTTGGPVGPQTLLARFRKGEVLHLALVRDDKGGSIFPEYTIVDRPEVGQISKGVVAQFCDLAK